jgi:hypothetical protein
MQELRRSLSIKRIASRVIDPKVPLTLTLSPKGRGDKIISPPLRGGDKGEGVIFMLLCERLLMSIPAKMTELDDLGNAPLAPS